MRTDSGTVLLALLSGAAIGAGVGILYAPDKGSNTRRKIKRKVEETSQDFAERISHAKDELTRSALEKREEFEHKLEVLRKKNAQLQK